MHEEGILPVTVFLKTVFRNNHPSNVLGIRSLNFQGNTADCANMAITALFFRSSLCWQEWDHDWPSPGPPDSPWQKDFPHRP